jgi:Tfp pilus assembly protein PilF
MNILNSAALHLRLGGMALALGLGIGLPVALHAQGTAAAASAPANTVRPEVGKPLQEAEDLLKAGNPKEALVRIAAAEAVPSLTPFESYAVQRSKGRAAMTADDLAVGIPAFEAVLQSSFLPAADRRPIVTVLAQASYQAKQYARSVGWLRRYAQEGGTDAAVLKLLPSALYLADDHAGVVKELAPQVQADAAAGRATEDTTLRMLASSQLKLGDDAGYRGTLERIAVLSGKADVWAELIVRTVKAANLGDRYRLDYYRLMHATGNLSAGDEALEMAYLAQQAGLPGEADAVLKAGDARGLFAGGAMAKQAAQLRQDVGKALAQDRKGMAGSEADALKSKDGNALFGLGLALSGDGQADRGATLMAQAVAKGGLKRPDEAMMRLGIAQWRAGRTDDAAKAFGAVQGGDGGPELARLWQAFVRSKAGGSKS